MDTRQQTVTTGHGKTIGLTEMDTSHTAGVGNKTATKFTQLNIEMRSYKMTANQVEQVQKNLLGKTFRSLVVNGSKSVET